jgi:flagellar M-ring protein FliF
MGFLQTIAHQYSAVWGRLSAGHRIILILLCLLCVVAVVGVVTWAGKPEYEILYPDLTAKECASLIAALKDARIPARVSEGGSAVMVPAAKLHQARMVGAEKGLPAGGRAGFDTFRDPKIGMTPFAERVNYLNALQNELVTTISSLDSVFYARVHLVVPERALFKKDQKQASASVLVVTKGGRALSREQALAITNLVASAVEGLSPENVTITDGRGNVLAGGEEGPGASADEQFAYRQRIESYLSSKAESMLAKVLGPGRSEVRVSAEVSFEDSRNTRRTYDPENRVVVSERVESSKTTGRSPEVGGAVGAAANAPGQAQPAAPSGPSQESKTENIDTKYMVSESVMESVDRGATIKRLTCAAFIDTSARKDQGEGAAPGPTLEDITRVLKDALGFDDSRGDSLKIVEAAFHPVTVELEGVGSGGKQWMVPAGQYLAIAMLALVLLLVARRVMKGIEAAAPRRVLVPEVMGLETEGRSAELNQDELVRREIARFVQDNPEVASRMLEGWVEGEE